VICWCEKYGSRRRHTASTSGSSGTSPG
jgi:hypothetical protein